MAEATGKYESTVTNDGSNQDTRRSNLIKDLITLLMIDFVMGDQSIEDSRRNSAASKVEKLMSLNCSTLARGTENDLWTDESGPYGHRGILCNMAICNKHWCTIGLNTSEIVKNKT